ncbi:MAG TPA: NAD(P)/FAD-dependent oxidoreductase [Ktedonobacteraceae bacterium]|nr:NAD(P)/FAD-dependent oxidoreductase [Ktedonobacteraceae bacterium]
MPESSLHVLIAGGGPGGLCLAQGLRKAGISVALYERDETPLIRKQGYRIHLDGRAASGLRACLPPHLLALFTATTSAPGQQITILNKHLRTLRVIGTPRQEGGPAPLSAGVDRQILREILLAELEDAVFFGKELSHYEQQEDGRVRACFADGTTACGDVLVGADGINSRVRQQLLPAAQTVDTGTRCIYGKVLLSEATRPLLPAGLSRGFGAVVSSRLGMALGLVDFQRDPAEAAREFAPRVHFHSAGSYLMWSLSIQRVHLSVSDDALLRMDGAALRQFTLQSIKSWHPDLRALVAASDPAEIFPIVVRVAVPCEPWPSGPVTLLGDAIHAMSPAGGSGANMALLDAGLLAQKLAAVARGDKPLISAIHEYEARMLADGFAAVRFSNDGGALSGSRPSLLRGISQAFRRK